MMIRIIVEERRATNASMCVVSFLCFVPRPEGRARLFCLYLCLPLSEHQRPKRRLAALRGKMRLLISLGLEACRCNRSVRASPGEGFYAQSDKLGKPLGPDGYCSAFAHHRTASSLRPLSLIPKSDRPLGLEPRSLTRLAQRF